MIDPDFVQSVMVSVNAMIMGGVGVGVSLGLLAGVSLFATGTNFVDEALGAAMNGSGNGVV